jgi:hypothetical protein
MIMVAVHWYLRYGRSSIPALADHRHMTPNV